MQTKIIEKYFFFGLLLATFIFTILIFSRFWIILVLGISFAIILRPMYEWFNKKKIPSAISSFLTVIIFMIVLLGPILGISVLVFNQSQDLYSNFNNNNGSADLINTLNQNINAFLPKGIDFNVQEKVADIILFISENTAKIFTSTLTAFFDFTLMLLAMYYFLKDGTEWKKYLIKLSPLNDGDDGKIIARLKLSVNSVIKGYLFIGVVQGVLSALGLWIFGVPHAALWGVVAGVASLIPMVGTGFVSAPAIIFLLLGGHSGAALGLLVWSVAIVGLVDNLLSPYIVSSKIKIPSLLILISVLGGISMLGPVGILVGPLTLSLMYTLISIYKDEYREEVTS
ncbi:MAG: AI-2E family transporter [bacterium]|nr:AI-2E family transporter [bacterium]